MKHPLLAVFVTAFLLFLVSISPILISSGGVYLWAGDYDEQSIVFVERIHRLLHSGEGLPAYDWGSFLGMDFLASYADFLFSPFNWLLFMLPYSIVPYAHTFVAALRVGLAAVTAYLYCRQYLKKDHSAFLCGLLYAFSGYQLFNMVFQFSDRYLMFPLLLYAFDKLVIDRKPLLFALLLAINSLMSTYFTWMICVNILIYFIVRLATKTYPRLTVKLFLRVAIETFGGVFAGAMTMIPGLLVLSGNKRASNFIFGSDLIAYENDGVILRILQSMFLAPDICRNGWYFKDEQLSMSPPTLFIPLFLVVGVAFIWRQNKKAWYSILLDVLAVIACVPVLNSLFSACNKNYYARWMFMPILIMILMTGKYLDRFEEVKPKTELKVCAVILGFWILYGVYAVFFVEPTFMLCQYYWLVAAACSALGLVTLFLFHYPHPKLRFLSFRYSKPLTCLFCALPFFGFTLSLTIAEPYDYVPREIASVWNDFEPVDLGDDSFYRTSSCSYSENNKSMMWDYPTLNAFNSMITPDTCDFFDTVDVRCTQSVKMDKDDYALCSFLSSKYDLYYNKNLTGGIEVRPEDLLISVEGFEMKQVCHRYVIYENKGYIPMGYTFDYYLPDASVEDKSVEDLVMEQIASTGIQEDEPELTHKEKQRLLLKAIRLSEEQIRKYSFLERLPEALEQDTSVATYYKDCEARAASACYAFEPNGHGFTAKIDLPQENLVFFSVPYTKYFKAYVDGQPAEIERVFDGLTAVYVPAGDHSIEYRYEIPGFRTGCIVSGICAGVLLLYTAIDLLRKHSRKRRQPAAA
ncbi:MAG: YfhO family protein [Oscillospiraceae bacterium]|nr:YfhO family protein [Oscillospiraceae bacterium]